jgi:hypothetical protein
LEISNMRRNHIGFSIFEFMIHEEETGRKFPATPISA